VRTLANEWSREQLLKLYQISIDEYRFEVKLNTDRMIHYIVANSIILSIGTGLLKLDSARPINLFVAFVFMAGAFAAYLGIRAIRRGHTYYHRTIHKKTVIEDLLGLTAPIDKYHGATLAISSTLGQADVLRIVNDPESWLAADDPKKGSIVHAAMLVLRMLMGMDILGAIAAVALVFGPLPYIPWP
jgi:hypothetical protein